MYRHVISLFALAIVLTTANAVFAAPEATDPYPRDGKSGVPVDVLQTWTPGDYVAPYVAGKLGNGHHVFLHPNQSWVENASLSYSLGFAQGHFRADSNSWSFSDPTFGTGFDLPEGSTYYWRIFEVNDVNPLSPFKSDVWSLTTVGSKASNPSPSDGSFGVDVNDALTWTPGTQVAYSPNGGHDVFFGTDQSDVATATVANPKGVYQIRQDPNSFSPGTLILGPTYYWRIDEVNDSSGTVTGDVWSFVTTGTGASVPNPADGTIVGELTDPTVDVNLSWLPGTYADSTDGHDVYFGTNLNEVNDLNSSDPDPNNVYKGPQTPAAYSLTALPLNLTFYWRIDEISTTHPDSPWKGSVWSFITSSGIATNPQPEDQKDRVSIEQQLSWTPGLCNIARHLLRYRLAPAVRLQPD